MLARLEYNLCHGGETQLVIYKTKKDMEQARSDDGSHILKFDLSNEQLTELMCVQGIKAKDMNI